MLCAAAATTSTTQLSPLFPEGSLENGVKAKASQKHIFTVRPKGFTITLGWPNLMAEGLRQHRSNLYVFHIAVNGNAMLMILSHMTIPVE